MSRNSLATKTGVSQSRASIRADGLRLILGGKTSTKMLPFVIAIFVVSALAITLVQGMVAQTGIRVEQKKNQLREVVYNNSNLEVELAQLTDPDYIYTNAKSYGLKLQQKVNYIYVDETNDVLASFMEGK